MVEAVVLVMVRFVRIDFAVCNQDAVGFRKKPIASIAC